MLGFVRASRIINRLNGHKYRNWMLDLQRACVTEEMSPEEYFDMTKPIEKKFEELEEHEKEDYAERRRVASKERAKTIAKEIKILNEGYEPRSCLDLFNSIQESYHLPIYHKETLAFFDLIDKMLRKKQHLLKLDLGHKNGENGQMPFQQYQEEYEKFIEKYKDGFWIPTFLAPDHGWSQIDVLLKY